MCEARVVLTSNMSQLVFQGSTPTTKLLAGVEGWRGTPHASLQKLGSYQGPSNILPLGPGHCLTSLGSS